MRVPVEVDLAPAAFTFEEALARQIAIKAEAGWFFGFATAGARISRLRSALAATFAALTMMTPGMWAVRIT
jgi:hypothetical protein